MNTKENFILWRDFPTTEKSEWLRQIQKENPTLDLGTLNQIIQDNFKSLAFANIEDNSFPMYPIPKQNHRNKWKTGTTIHTKEQLDSSLESGVEYLHIEMDHVDPESINDLLQGVMVDLLFIRWSVADMNKSNALHSSVAEKYTSQNAYCITPIKYEVQDVVENIKNKVPIKIEFNFDIDHLSSWPNHLQAVTDFVSQLHDAGIQHPLQHAWISIQLQDDFLTNICTIRALRLVLQKVAEDMNLPFLLYTDAQIKNSVPNENRSPLIRSTLQSMCAALAGCEYISFRLINAAEQTNPNTTRNHILLQHILKLESQLENVNDPLAGSYYIENLTEQMASSWWNELKY